MDIDTQIARAKELIAKREEIDIQLAVLFGGLASTRKARSCKLCGSPDHDARSCNQPEKPADSSKLI